MDYTALKGSSKEALIELIHKLEGQNADMRKDMEFLQSTVRDLTQINLRLSAGDKTPSTKDHPADSSSAGPPTVGAREPKEVPGWVQTLDISDSYHRRVNRKDISEKAFIHSYSSVTIKELTELVPKYRPSARAENIVLHVGHNTIDNGTTTEEAKKQYQELVQSVTKKFKPLKVFVCELPPVKNGRYGRADNNPLIREFNKSLKEVVETVRQEHANVTYELIENSLSPGDICPDGVHPAESGIKKMVRNIRDALRNAGTEVADTEPQFRMLPPRKPTGPA